MHSLKLKIKYFTLRLKGYDLWGIETIINSWTKVIYIIHVYVYIDIVNYVH